MSARSSGSDGLSRQLVRVAVTRHLAEAEFVQGLLAEEGIPSLVRRNPGADVPDFLSGGVRDVLVPRARELEAREVLLQAEVIGDEPRRDPGDSPLRLVGALVLLLLAGLLVLWLGLR